ncbi:hypothetical protein VTO73DRAFT_15326 [Trametes versicolor]
MARSNTRIQLLRRSIRIASRKLPPKPSSVCEDCWNGPFAAQLGLLHAPFKWAGEGGYSYSTSREQLKRSAAAGCAWCKCLYQKLLQRGSVVKGIKGLPSSCLSITIGSPGGGVGITPTNVQNLRVAINNDKNFDELLLHASEDDPAAPHIVARDPILDVGSSRTLSLAKALINECAHGHERCRTISPSSAVRLPTRLVDCTDPAHPRLVLTEGKHGTYLALSYVWGEAQPHKTTKSNISAYSARIDASLLPQTILDAIYVTHTLGFQYLWADSLCIVQDSDEDKLHEIGRMHLIYRHAYLTIIAASAERVTDGFLQDRLAEPYDLTLPFLCPPPPPTSGDDAAEVQQVGEVHCSHRSWGVDAPDPVDRRGWCLQELYMSPRALIFASKTLRFGCQETTPNVGNSIRRTYMDVRLPDILFHPAPPPVQHGSKEWADIHTQWGRIANQYNGRTLGQASDKLVACGALAEAFHRVLRSDYLAGMWRDTLLYDLLWRAHRSAGDPDSGQVSRSAEYRAPSWSWAAVDRAVDSRGPPYNAPHMALAAAVVSCEVTLKTPELPFGEVTGGSLVLRATLIPCKVRMADNGLGAEILFVRPSARGRCSGVVDAANAIVEDGKFLGLCSVDHDSDLLVERESEWLVPLLRRTNAPGAPSAYGLIVTLANPDSGNNTESRKVCRRLGEFTTLLSWDKLLSYAPTLEEITIV